MCVFLTTAGEQEVTDPSWVLGMNTLSSLRTSCPRLFPALDSPDRVQVYHGSVTAYLLHAHSLLHFQEGQLSSDLYFDPLGEGSDWGKRKTDTSHVFSLLFQIYSYPKSQLHLGDY